MRGLSRNGVCCPAAMAAIGLLGRKRDADKTVPCGTTGERLWKQNGGSGG